MPSVSAWIPDHHPPLSVSFLNFSKQYLISFNCLFLSLLLSCNFMASKSPLSTYLTLIKLIILTFRSSPLNTYRKLCSLSFIQRERLLGSKRANSQNEESLVSDTLHHPSSTSAGKSKIPGPGRTRSGWRSAGAGCSLCTPQSPKSKVLSPSSPPLYYNPLIFIFHHKSQFIKYSYYICQGIIQFTIYQSQMIVQGKDKGKKDVFDFSDLMNILALEVEDKEIPPSGLYIRNQGVQDIDDVIMSLPLKDITYHVEIINNLARISLDQEYQNPTDHYLEVEYCFPIQPNAVIHSFIAKFGKKSIVGKIKTKPEAKEDYDEGLEEGRNVAYGEIDELSSDILNLKIGNIPPKTSVSISIEYVQELDVVMSTFWRFTLVSHVMPRYIMQDCPEGWKNAVKEYKHLKRYTHPKYAWSFDLTIVSQSPITFRSSTTHTLVQIPTINKPQQHRLKFQLGKKQTPKKDFVFMYSTEATPRYTLGVTDSGKSAVVSFIPKFAEVKPSDAYNMMLKGKDFGTNFETVTGEYIFILDRSGSMSGTLIENAIEALVLFIQSLPTDCFINIVSFGSEYQLMFPKSQRYSDEIIKTVNKKLKTFSADFGGTEIYTPLQYVLGLSLIKNYPRHVFLLTDGGVSDTKSVIKLVENKSSTARVHTIGIGHGVSEALIKQCANKGKGKYVFIKESQEISGSIVQLLQQSLSRVITHVEVDFDESIIDSIVPNPKEIPFILENNPMNLYIKFNDKFTKSTKFTLRYTDPEGAEFQNIVKIEPNKKIAFPFVEKMVQHKKIMTLYNRRQNAKGLKEDIYVAKIKNIEETIVNDSVKYQVLCPLTAFICVGDKLNDEEYGRFLAGDDERRNRFMPSGKAISKSVRGRGGSGGRGGKGGKGAGKSVGIRPPHRFRPGTVAIREISKKKRISSRKEENECEEESRSSQSSEEASVDKGSASKISLVLKHQNFDGCWKSTDELLKILFSKTKIEALKKLSKAKGIDESYILTCLITRWIEVNHKGPQYSLILRKAKVWLNKTLAVDKKTLEEIQKLAID